MNIMDIKFDNGSYLRDINSSACLFIQEFLINKDEQQAEEWCFEFSRGVYEKEVRLKMKQWGDQYPTRLNKDFFYDAEIIAITLQYYLEDKKEKV